jgi:phosphonate transport system substrate-binding protein
MEAPRSTESPSTGSGRILTALLLFFLTLSPSARAAEITIGLIPEQNVFEQMARYEPIGKYIQKRTDIKVRFTILSRYGNILESFVEDDMDAAFWGSFTGALAIEKLGIEPLVRPLWLDETSSYRGYIFVRKDSGIKSVKDMKGRSIVFVDKATTAGYIFPMAFLREHGVTDIDSYFKEHYFAGSHDAAISAVLDKKVDIGCAKNTILHHLGEEDPRVEEDLLLLAHSEEFPSNALGVRSDLSPEIKTKIRNALLGMDDVAEGRAILKEFHAIRFIATSREDYAPVFHSAAKAGIDLKNYEYRNK